MTVMQVRKLTVEGLVQSFKLYAIKEFGYDLDFRSEVYIDNNYKNAPMFSYAFGEMVVTHLYMFANGLVQSNPDSFPDFAGFLWNKQMACESLRSTKLVHLVKDVMQTLVNFQAKASA